MTSSIKNYLGLAGVVALLAFAFSAVFGANSYSRSLDPASFGSFSVASEGKAVGVPDVAQFTFGVITQGGKDLAKLQKENTEKANGAIAFLRGKGVEPKDVKTENYAIEPRYQYASCPREGGACPPPEIVGYAIRQSVSVKVRDFSKLGDMLAGLVKTGVNTVSDVSFVVDEPEELENKARVEAIEKAKRKAKALAEAGRFRLGKLLSIEEGGAGPRPFLFKAAREASSVGPEAPVIEPGSQEITVTMTLTYEIK